ncbi:tail fiber domain-containing protein [Spirosoma jeollabukense]
MKKSLLSKTIVAATFAVMLSAATSVVAQVKIGSNPTVIGTNENLEVEDASGTKTVITKDKGFVGIGTNAPIARLYVHETIAPVFGSTIAAFGRPGNKLFFFETSATLGAYNGLVKDGDSHVIFSPDGDPYAAANAGLVIGPWSTDQTSPGLKIMENGNVGVGTPAPPAKLSVYGGMAYFGTDAAPNIGAMTQGNSPSDGIIFQNQNGAASDGAIVIQRSGASNYSPMYVTRNGALGSGAGYLTVYSVNGAIVGSISTSGTTTSFNTTSDIRLKENIKATHYGLSDLMKIRVADYNYKNDTAKKRTTGFLAQELYKIFPEAVTVGSEDVTQSPWVVDYSKVTPLLVKAIQDLNVKVEKLTAENVTLKAQASDMASLKAEMASIKALLEVNKEGTQKVATK